jgi:hypothetical protein
MTNVYYALIIQKFYIIVALYTATKRTLGTMNSVSAEGFTLPRMFKKEKGGVIYG